jgi:hypothetical protein
MPISIAGSGTITGISAGGLPDDCITTADIAAGAVTQAKRSEQLTLGTAVASTSGTSIDFTGIPSWVKRVTVMFNGVSTNGTDNWIIQVGSGSILTSGYNGCSTIFSSSTLSTGVYTAGWGIKNDLASSVVSGSILLTLVGSNVWVASGVLSTPNTSPNMYSILTSGSVTLSGALDRVRLTSLNGVNTFDAGSINIMYE